MEVAGHTPIYTTALGAAYCTDADIFLRELSDSSINLILTSPPYALNSQKEYGNPGPDAYVAWFLPFAREIFRVLADDGSFVLNLGGCWEAGRPTRSLYHHDLLLALCRTVGFSLAQEFFWFNGSKLPSPAPWVTIQRIRVKDAVEYIWWLSRTHYPKADNRRVLNEVNPITAKRNARGYSHDKFPSGHTVKGRNAREVDGSIPPNLISCGNSYAHDAYQERCRATGTPIHPARFPLPLPTFFVRFLTNPGDLVLDPFAGSNTTGEACERDGRYWIAVDRDPGYIAASRYRFFAPEPRSISADDETQAVLPETPQ